MITRAFKIRYYGEPKVVAQIVSHGWVVWTKSFPGDTPLRTARLQANVYRSTHYGRYL